MNLLFFTEARLSRINNKFYASDESFSYRMFRRYLKVFDRVKVVARTSPHGNHAADENSAIDNDRVEVLPLPHYIGPVQYLFKRSKLERSIQGYIDANPHAAAICRVPGMIGTTASRYFRCRNRRYGVEVVGDPMDVFAPGSSNHLLRKVFRYLTAKDLKTVVGGAAASLYVTKSTLQKRYSPAANSFSTHASNVMLPATAFAASAKSLKKTSSCSIVAVGSLAALYKSPDIAIGAMSILDRMELGAILYWIGGGKYHSRMVEKVKRAGMSGRVKFVGNVASAREVREYLDAADLFVIPSRSEGLPRALLEAMARGLPCIGTDVGGIPEVLDRHALVPANDPSRLAEKIKAFLTAPAFADAQAKRNLEVAKGYACEILEPRRVEFYNYLKGVSSSCARCI